MSASALRVRRWVGRHWARLGVAAILIGVVGGLALGLAAGTRRTDSAPDRYTRHFGGDPDLLITQLSGQPLDEQVARLPGVESIESIVFVPSFLVSPRDGSLVFEPNSFAGDDDAVGRRAVKGRLVDPSHPDEFTVNRSMAALLSERFGTRVGDRFQVRSYDQHQVAGNFDTAEAPAVPPFAATLVGVTDAPTDFDDSSPQMVFPRSFLGAHPDVGVVQTIMAARLAPGIDPRDVMDAIHQLPNGDDAYSAPQRIVSDSARRAVRFQVTALWVVTALSVLAAAVVIAQVVSRTLPRRRRGAHVHGRARLAPAGSRGRASGRRWHRRHRRPAHRRSRRVRPHVVVPAGRAAVDRTGRGCPRGLARDRGRPRRAGWRGGGDGRRRRDAPHPRREGP